MRRSKSRQSFLVIGLGRFGSSLAIELTDLGHEVMGVDVDMKVVEAHKDQVYQVLQMDGCNRHALEELAVQDYDAVIVGRGEDLGQSISITMNLMELKARRVIAKAVTEQHAFVLEKLGVKPADIVFPERDQGHRLAHTLGNRLIQEFFTLAGDLSVLQVEAPASCHNKTLLELDLRKRFGITVMVIRRDEDSIQNPGGDTRIQPGDKLVVLGQEEAIEELLLS